MKTNKWNINKIKTTKLIEILQKVEEDYPDSTIIPNDAGNLTVQNKDGLRKGFIDFINHEWESPKRWENNFGSKSN